jgi:histone acetyltransferase
MEEKLKTHQYSSLRDFIDDAQLMIDNCRLYYPEDSTYTSHVNQLEKFLEDWIPEYMVTDNPDHIIFTPQYSMFG